MRKLLSLLLAVILLYSFAFSVSARPKQVDNVYFSVYGDLEAYFYADELIENGSLLIYKDDKTGYTATMEIVEQNEDSTYTALIHFEDGKARTGLTFVFDTDSNTITHAYNFYGEFPFRKTSIHPPVAEQSYYGTRAYANYECSTLGSYAGESIEVELRDKGLFYVRRFVLDSHAKGGYDGLTIKSLFYRVLNILPYIIIIILIGKKFLKNKKVSA